MDHEMIELYDRTWAIEDEDVRIFVIAGESSALVVDTGVSSPDVEGPVRQVTDLPLKLRNTHADKDHISGNWQFDECYMHPAEACVYHNINMAGGTVLPVWEGDCFDLGGRSVEILHVPGHSPGSITVLDPQERCLIGGDPILKGGEIFMFGVHRDMQAYVAGLRHLLEVHGDRFDWIYPSHAELKIGKDVIGQLIQGACDIMDGKVPHTDVERFGTKAGLYDVGVTSFICDPLSL